MFKKTNHPQLILEAMSKIYHLKLWPRATDNMRKVDIDMTLQARLSENILEHGSLTARLAEFICLAYKDEFALELDEPIDPMQVSFQAHHHDDPEWYTQDWVVSLGYGGNSKEEKIRAEQEAIEVLYGAEPNFILDALQSYGCHADNNSKLVKICDILELFIHNRVLARFGFGIVTWENYEEFDESTLEESEFFLRMHDESGETGPLTIAEILEYNYTEIFKNLDMPPIFQQMFYEMKEAIIGFRFEDHINPNTPPYLKKVPD